MRIEQSTSEHESSFPKMEEVVGEEPALEIDFTEDERVPESWRTKLGRIWFRGKAKRVVLTREDDDEVRGSRASFLGQHLDDLYEFLFPGHRSLKRQQNEQGLTNLVDPNEAKHKNMPHFNGMMVRLTNIKLHHDDLEIKPKLIDYFTYLILWYLKRGSDRLSNPNVLVIGQRIVTTDGFLVFARRGKGPSTGNGQIGNFGGCWNHYDRKQDEENWNVQKLALNELGDELLGKAYVAEHEDELVPVLEGVAHDRLQRPVILFTFHIPFSREELQDKFDLANKEAVRDNEIVEHDELVFIQNTAPGILATMKTWDVQQWHEPANLILGMAMHDALNKD